ncbi:MAG TPA: toxin-antitoxin system HicB family antitoxin [Streptosporangiaceae bacterium]|nr:toxin-antitoxin system HicB family antitoxin [Streptosporangiaceae bacterium]
MELSPYVEGLRQELGSLTRFASDDVIQVAERLAGALDSSVRLTLLDVLAAAAAEITTRFDDAVIDVRLSGGEPEFVVTAVPTRHDEQAPAPGPAEAGGDDAGTARVTLRLSESLKARVEAEAATAGISVNSWLAHAAIRALDDPGPVTGQRQRTGPARVGQRITGYARG